MLVSGLGVQPHGESQHAGFPASTWVRVLGHKASPAGADGKIKGTCEWEDRQGHVEQGHAHTDVKAL